MAGFRLFLVDDDDDDFLIIRQAFEELGQAYELTHVRDGKQLLDRLRSLSADGKTLPDLILMDINMPKLNGLETLAAIRSDKTYVKLPVFMYSTSVNADDRQKCMQLGASAFFTKAYSYKKLLSFASEIDAFLKNNDRQVSVMFGKKNSTKT